MERSADLAQDGPAVRRERSRGCARRRPGAGGALLHLLPRPDAQPRVLQGSRGGQQAGLPAALHKLIFTKRI